jgi:hypothetical protein
VALCGVLFVQKCHILDYIKTWSCSRSRLNMHTQKLNLNLDLAQMYHKKWVTCKQPSMHVDTAVDIVGYVAMPAALRRPQ